MLFAHIENRAFDKGEKPECLPFHLIIICTYCSLFFAQQDNWIDGEGVPGWNPGCGEAHQQHG
jgi:hypothetical protein